jgi:hypothetical protein
VDTILGSPAWRIKMGWLVAYNTEAEATLFFSASGSFCGITGCTRVATF